MDSEFSKASNKQGVYAEKKFDAYLRKHVYKALSMHLRIRGYKPSRYS